MQRFLWSLAPMQAQPYTDFIVSDSTRAAYYRLVDDLFAMRGRETEDDKGMVPVHLTFTDDAQREWAEFHNAHDQEKMQLSDENEQSAMSKLLAYAARLAGLFHCVRFAAGDTADQFRIDAESLRAGCGLMQWYKHEGRRVFELFTVDPITRAQDELIDWIIARGGSVSITELKNSGPRAYRVPGAAESALQHLRDDGFGTLEYPPQQGRGRPFAPVFTLNGINHPEARINHPINSPEAADTDENRSGAHHANGNGKSLNAAGDAGMAFVHPIQHREELRR
jgi:hypothetical protein